MPTKSLAYPLILFAAGIFTLTAIILAILAATGVLKFGNAVDSNGNPNTPPTENPGNEQPTETPIKSTKGVELTLVTPKSGATVSCPITVKGAISGSWYFEASFEAQLVDENGKVLDEAPAQAQGEWMTSEDVDFEAKLDCGSTCIGDGKIILMKSNASGLPANDDKIEIPVKFDGQCTPAAEEKMTVKVYFANTKNDPQMLDCTKLTALTRSVTKTTAVGTAAIKQLIAGPSSGEKQQGYISNIPTDTTLLSLEIKDGTAFVNFSDELSADGGSCKVEMIRAQIEQTLKQFSTVKQVTIAIEGKTEDILQP